MGLAVRQALERCEAYGPFLEDWAGGGRGAWGVGGGRCVAQALRRKTKEGAPSESLQWLCVCVFLEGFMGFHLNEVPAESGPCFRQIP